MSQPHGATMPKGNLPDFLLSATAAMTFATDPEIWPQFMEWLSRNHPEALAVDTGEETRLEVISHVAELLNALNVTVSYLN